MNIAITGATGFVGSHLCQALTQKGYKLTILTRRGLLDKDRISVPAKLHAWDHTSPIPPSDIKSIDVVINLAGENISNKRWSEKNKQSIITSRIKTTLALAKTIADSHNQFDQGPSLFLSASAIGFYGYAPQNAGHTLTETSPKGEGFLAQLCHEWENAAFDVFRKLSPLTTHDHKPHKTLPKVITPRIGVVLGKNGGMMQRLLPVYRMGGGGRMGTGQQWMSWIHIDDLVAALCFVIEQHASFQNGPVNLVAPEPIKQSEFADTLAGKLQRPQLGHIPGFVLKILLGDMAKELFLASQKAIPDLLLKRGYSFRYKNADAALDAILK